MCFYTSFSTKFGAETNFHFTKKHSTATARVVHTSEVCDKYFHGFSLMREKMAVGTWAQRGSGTKNVDVLN